MSSEKMVVTPWEVSGALDYDKLVKEFGVSRIDEKLHKRIVKLAGEDHPWLRRGIFFAHTNLDKVLDAIEKGEPVWLYTGRAPSGPVHLGHVVPWLFTKWLQDRLGLRLLFQVPDEEKYLFKDTTLEEAKQWTEDNLLDIVAMGFDPERTKIIVDTKHADLMYSLAVQVAKRTTASQAKALFGLKPEDNVGKYFYSCMQSVPCFLPTELEGKPTPTLIPCAIDQDVHFRLTRDVAPKLGYPKPSTILCRFLPALSSDGKMSSSGEQVIAMSDDAKAVRKKIMKYAFSGGKDTVEEHRKHGGDPDADVAYQWLTFFEPDDAKLADVRRRYERGDLLSGELKQLLVDAIVPFIEEHQRRKSDARGKTHQYLIR